MSERTTRRPINPQALASYAAQQKLARPLAAGPKRTLSVGRNQLIPVVRAEVGAETPVPVYLYRIFVTVTRVSREAGAPRRTTVAGEDDIRALRDLLTRDFGGVTTLHQNPSPLQGSGARDPQHPGATLEQDEHAAFEVLASATHQSDVYFSALRRELEEALGEGVVLIQRFEVTLIGSLVPARP